MSFIHHLLHNWPLTLIVVGLAIGVPIVFSRGVLYLNAGPVRRSREPDKFRKWSRQLLVILVIAAAVLIGSYFLDPSK